MSYYSENLFSSSYSDYGLSIRSYNEDIDYD